MPNKSFINRPFNVYYKQSNVQGMLGADAPLCSYMEGSEATVKDGPWLPTKVLIFPLAAIGCFPFSTSSLYHLNNILRFAGQDFLWADFAELPM